MHISKDIIGSKGQDLAGKKIVLCLTGSVAILKFMEIARELMRWGAEVYPVMSPAALELITADFVHWATGNIPVTRLSGRVEHVELAGNVPGKADLILVAPATANTIGKVASGIDDTPVTTVVTTALGEKIPVIIAPAMHLPMYKHPVVTENIRKLQHMGVRFLDPRISEGKAKLADSAVILQEIRHILQPSGPLSGKRVLITAGPTLEYIDPVRIITNKSSGKMGVALAEKALRLGADVILVYGPGTAVPPAGVKVVRVETAEEMLAAVSGELKAAHCDMVIAAAAVGDWTVKHKAEKKISTHRQQELILKLTPTAKIIDQIKKISPRCILVCFRALTAATDQELIDNAYQRLQKAVGDYIVVNDVTRAGAGFDVDTNEVFIVDKQKQVTHISLRSKALVAEAILEIVRLP